MFPGPAEVEHQMLLQTNSYIVPKERRAEHARLLRRFRSILIRLGCEQFEVYEQMGANWSASEATGRFVQIMRFRDRKHQRQVHGLEQTDPAAQQLINEFCELINLPYQQQQGLLAIGYYTGVPEAMPGKTRSGEGPGTVSDTLPPMTASSGFGLTGGLGDSGTPVIPPFGKQSVEEDELFAGEVEATEEASVIDSADDANTQETDGAQQESWQDEAVPSPKRPGLPPRTVVSPRLPPLPRTPGANGPAVPSAGKSAAPPPATVLGSDSDLNAATHSPTIGMAEVVEGVAAAAVGVGAGLSVVNESTSSPTVTPLPNTPSTPPNVPARDATGIPLTIVDELPPSSPEDDALSPPALESPEYESESVEADLTETTEAASSSEDPFNVDDLLSEWGTPERVLEETEPKVDTPTDSHVHQIQSEWDAVSFAVSSNTEDVPAEPTAVDVVAATPQLLPAAETNEFADESPEEGSLAVDELSALFPPGESHAADIAETVEDSVELPSDQELSLQDALADLGGHDWLNPESVESQTPHEDLLANFELSPTEVGNHSENPAEPEPASAEVTTVPSAQKHVPESWASDQPSEGLATDDLPAFAISHQTPSESESAADAETGSVDETEAPIPQFAAQKDLDEIAGELRDAVPLDEVSESVDWTQPPELDDLLSIEEPVEIDPTSSSTESADEGASWDELDLALPEKTGETPESIDIAADPSLAEQEAISIAEPEPSAEPIPMTVVGVIPGLAETGLESAELRVADVSETGLDAASVDALHSPVAEPSRLVTDEGELEIVFEAIPESYVEEVEEGELEVAYHD